MEQRQQEFIDALERIDSLDIGVDENLSLKTLVVIQSYVQDSNIDLLSLTFDEAIDSYLKNTEG